VYTVVPRIAARVASRRPGEIYQGEHVAPLSSTLP
jgi:hypothetical protein